MSRAPERLIRWLSWPEGVLRLGVGACVVVASGAALLLYPAQLREFDEVADANASSSYADRDVGAGNSVMPEQRALYEIRGRIPVGAGYRIAVGPAREDWPELTAAGAEGFLHNWLMPRRPQPDSEWVICVGCDPSEYTGATEEWAGEAGIRLLRLPS